MVYDIFKRRVVSKSGRKDLVGRGKPFYHTYGVPGKVYRERGTKENKGRVVHVP